MPIIPLFPIPPLVHLPPHSPAAWSSSQQTPYRQEHSATQTPSSGTDSSSISGGGSFGSRQMTSHDGSIWLQALEALILGLHPISPPCAPHSACGQSKGHRTHAKILFPCSLRQYCPVPDTLQTPNPDHPRRASPSARQSACGRSEGARGGREAS